MKERRHDLDSLRVVAMLAVFIFHCTRFFDTEGWHLKNSEQNHVLFVLMRGLFWPWMNPGRLFEVCTTPMGGI